MSNSFTHFPISISLDGDVVEITQSFGATADDDVVIKISPDQAKQIAKFLSSAVKGSLQETEQSGTASGFLDFWYQYPRKNNKAAALACWKRQNLDKHQERVMAHLNSVMHTEQWTKDGGKFVPYAATYLNRRVYLDDIEVEDNSRYV